jgi:hypothetical protein
MVSLDISSSKISQEGGVSIAEALGDNKTLMTIKLHDNFLSEGKQSS